MVAGIAIAGIVVAGIMSVEPVIAGPATPARRLPSARGLLHLLQRRPELAARATCLILLYLIVP